MIFRLFNFDLNDWRELFWLSSRFWTSERQLCVLMFQKCWGHINSVHASVCLSWARRPLPPSWSSQCSEESPQHFWSVPPPGRPLFALSSASGVGNFLWHHFCMLLLPVWSTGSRSQILLSVKHQGKHTVSLLKSVCVFAVCRRRWTVWTEDASDTRTSGRGITFIYWLLSKSSALNFKCVCLSRLKTEATQIQRERPIWGQNLLLTTNHQHAPWKPGQRWNENTSDKRKLKVYCSE